MRLAIRKTECSTYYVVLGWDVYEMSVDADKPNGVCIHLGVVEPQMFYDIKTVHVEDVPFGIVKQIVHLLECAAVREFNLAQSGTRKSC